MCEHTVCYSEHTMPDHLRFFNLAAEVAKKVTCERAKCGSVVVAASGEVIGEGYNAPPLEDESQRICSAEWRLNTKPKYDKTCCVHAEWNATLNACKYAPDKLEEATLYFMRIDEDGNFTDAGEPYCTVCSRLALQSGIAQFALWNNGPDIYMTTDYNRLSYAYYSEGFENE